MARGDSNDGCANVVGGFVVFIVVLVAIIPKEVWIALGIFAAVAVLVTAIVKGVAAYDEHRAEAQEQARIEQAKQVAAAKRDREERARKEKQRRIATLGEKNAALVDSAQAAVKRVVESEAARAGWLGDVDFTTDIQGITDNFQKAHALGKVAKELAALDKPGVDDRKILAEAKATIATLERAAIERVALIKKCATEARLVDASLRSERQDSQAAEQRAELHAKLTAMLYGIEATPKTTPTDSAADAVMARVQAYREIKNQIQQARNDGSR